MWLKLDATARDNKKIRRFAAALDISYPEALGHPVASRAYQDRSGLFLHSPLPEPGKHRFVLVQLGEPVREFGNTSHLVVDLTVEKDRIPSGQWIVLGLTNETWEIVLLDKDKMGSYENWIVRGLGSCSRLLNRDKIKRIHPIVGQLSEV